MLTVLIFNKNVEAACTQDEYGGQCVEYVRNYFGGSYELMPGLCQYDPDCGARNAWDHWDLGFGSGQKPADNSIMVIDQFPRIPTGHMAVVISAISNIDGTYTLKVQESNWDLDELVDCDVSYTFYPNDSEATREGGVNRYTILGFIYGESGLFSFKYTDFSDLSDFTLNGSAASIGNPVFFNGQDVLRLTNDDWQAGSAFLAQSIDLTDGSFTTSFSFQISNSGGGSDDDGVGADGLVFTIATQPDVVGQYGGSIGYGGINPSIGIEFDTYNNGVDYDGNHVGINLNGSLSSVASVPITPRMNDGFIWYVWIDYNGANNLLEVRLSQTNVRPADPILSHPIDLIAILGTNNIFFGFTSGTGRAFGDHDIRDWMFTTDEPVATEKVPVLIVPGIMGSFSSCLFSPECTDYNWDPFGPINIDLTRNWVLDPIDFIGYDPTYESLLQAFRDAGYVDGVTLFPVPYDWRNRNQDTATEFLEAAIESAKQASGHTEVDIVAHSMGGLVTRWYIEGMDRSDIRKFVMLGTPNHGSAKAYFPWEGGNFSVYSYLERAWFIEPMIEDMKVGYEYEELSDREFVQEMIPSVRQLLPVYNYIYNLDTASWITVDNMIWQNDLIPYLNYNILVSNLEINDIAIGAGTGQKTLWAIAVHNSTGPDWVDGIPHYLPPNEASGEYKTFGDNTVLTGSAKLGNINYLEAEGEHGDLPHIGRNKVVDFISDQQIQAVEATEESVGLIEQKDTFSMESLLFIGTRSNVLMGLTSKEGYRVGRFANMAGKVAEIENYYYRGNEQRTPALGIYNPSAGEYVLSITTKEPMVEYEIYISQSDKKKGKKQKTKLRGILRQNEINKHVIKINEKLEAF
ncbi:MAG: CHAP domain-containing protein [Bacteroidota bacterium]